MREKWGPRMMSKFAAHDVARALDPVRAVGVACARVREPTGAHACMHGVDGGHHSISPHDRSSTIFHHFTIQRQRQLPPTMLGTYPYMLGTPSYMLGTPPTRHPRYLQSASQSQQWQYHRHNHGHGHSTHIAQSQHIHGKDTAPARHASTSIPCPQPTSTIDPASSTYGASARTSAG